MSVRVTTPGRVILSGWRPRLLWTAGLFLTGFVFNERTALSGDGAVFIWEGAMAKFKLVRESVIRAVGEVEAENDSEAISLFVDGKVTWAEDPVPVQVYLKSVEEEHQDGELQS